MLALRTYNRIQQVFLSHGGHGCCSSPAAASAFLPVDRFHRRAAVVALALVRSPLACPFPLVHSPPGEVGKPPERRPLSAPPVEVEPASEEEETVLRTEISP